METCKPAPFVVQPEWLDREYYVGTMQLGDALPSIVRGKWLAWRHNDALGTFNTEAEARAAVEAAVREALGGKPV